MPKKLLWWLRTAWPGASGRGLFLRTLWRRIVKIHAEPPGQAVRSHHKHLLEHTFLNLGELLCTHYGELLYTQTTGMVKRYCNHSEIYAHKILEGRLCVALRWTYGVLPKKVTPERPYKKATTVESAARLCEAAPDDFSTAYISG